MTFLIGLVPFSIVYLIVLSYKDNTLDPISTIFAVCIGICGILMLIALITILGSFIENCITYFKERK